MNRRTFLPALAATSLTPIMPAQIFASGGIASPEHCGYVGIDPVSMLIWLMADYRLLHGDGTGRKSGLITT